MTRALIARSEARLKALRPRDRASLRRFNKQMGPAFKHAISAEYPDAFSVRDIGRTKHNTYIVQRLLLGRQGDRIPALLFTPRTRRKTFPATLIVHPEGKAALADLTRGVPGPIVSDLLKHGHRVLAIDVFLTGEFHSSFARAKRNINVSQSPLRVGPSIFTPLGSS